jgi:hypothetical protein
MGLCLLLIVVMRCIEALGDHGLHGACSLLLIRGS